MQSQSLSIQSELLLELADRYPARPAIVLGGQAALANALGGEVRFAPTDVRERSAAEVPIAQGSNAQLALLPAPPDRDLLRAQLLAAAGSLAVGGTLIMCGAKVEGGKSAVKDAEALLGPPVWSGYREKHRMAIFTRGNLLEPAWANEPGIAPNTWKTFAIDTSAGELSLETRAGVFAGARLDAGTRLLLEHVHIHEGASVLDIGCGAGVIGLTAAALGAGAVTMTDANLIAVDVAARNADSHGVNVRVLASDVYDALENDRFDLIISNPPFHRGKQVDLTVANRIIGEAPRHLNPGGSLLLVANAFLAYGRQMEPVFDRVETVASTSQYHVLRGELNQAH